MICTKYPKTKLMGSIEGEKYSLITVPHSLRRYTLIALEVNAVRV